MIKTKPICACDICGKTVDAVAKAWPYHEAKYYPPEGWGKGAENTDVDICPECLKKLRRPLGNCRGLEDTAQSCRDEITPASPKPKFRSEEELGQ